MNSRPLHIRIALEYIIIIIIIIIIIAIYINITRDDNEQMHVKNIHLTPHHAC